MPYYSAEYSDSDSTRHIPSRRDDDQSMNKGVFREFIEFLAGTDPLLKDHFEHAPGQSLLIMR